MTNNGKAICRDQTLSKMYFERTKLTRVLRETPRIEAQKPRSPNSKRTWFLKSLNDAPSTFIKFISHRWSLAFSLEMEYIITKPASIESMAMICNAHVICSTIDKIFFPVLSTSRIEIVGNLRTKRSWIFSFWEGVIWFRVAIKVFGAWSRTPGCIWTKKLGWKLVQRTRRILTTSAEMGIPPTSISILSWEVFPVPME